MIEFIKCLKSVVHVLYWKKSYFGFNAKMVNQEQSHKLHFIQNKFHISFSPPFEEGDLNFCSDICRLMKIVLIVVKDRQKTKTSKIDVIPSS